MNNAAAEAIDEFIALGHLESREESVIATVNGIGCDNHFLLADSHNLRIHCGMCYMVKLLLLLCFPRILYVSEVGVLAHILAALPIPSIQHVHVLQRFKPVHRSGAEALNLDAFCIPNPEATCTSSD